MESPDSSWIKMFVCANCARPAKVSSSARRDRSEIPDFGLPGRVDRTVVPCAGRMQPEHVLKALEAGADVVVVVACEEGNCHYSEGSRRLALRMEYLRSLMEEIGLGDGRLVLGHLPGTAVQDMLLTASRGRKAGAAQGDGGEARELEEKIRLVREQTLEALRVCPPNPLGAAARADRSGKSGK